MAKAVLLSIRPEWVEKIASGQKTVEIRKNCPKITAPFKCYIYCTGVKNMRLDDYVAVHRTSGGRIDEWGGKVIGEFVCDGIDSIQKRGVNDNFDYCYLSLNEWGNDDIETEIRDIKASLIPKDTLSEYGEKSHCLYAWHISKLQIYDKPRELGEFMKTAWDCRYADVAYLGPKCECCRDGDCMMKRPPQSWCYVEELSNE